MKRLILAGILILTLAIVIGCVQSTSSVLTSGFPVLCSTIFGQALSPGHLY